MKIAIACDHGGYVLKTAVIEHLKEKGYEVTDFGCDSTASVDYPSYARKVAQTVAAGEADKGIVICTTGIGVSIVANKVKGVRCALCSEQTSARLTRMHNDANVLAMGGGIVGPNLGIDIVDTFLNTEFCGEEKHARRIAAIE
ncbi:MAG: ribose 5-phosphate isomerase B [Lachnospiraceae bacterium]|nr:ribose 5-phosphate isomerase B [Lachnospiraceae bacterium]